MSDLLFHFSEDPTIVAFEPHVPATNLAQPPAVWAIDDVHSPLYWFPRDCPRVTCWPRGPDERRSFDEMFLTSAHRIHAIELGWLTRLRSAELFRYSFDAAPFTPWAEASGQWISPSRVEPVAVEPVGDLLDAHVEAGIDFRALPSLWPLHDAVRSGRAWDFSIVRMLNAQPRGPHRPSQVE